MRPCARRVCPDFSSIKEEGAYGEEVAASFLRRQGCRVLARNYAGRWGEVDVVVRDGESLVFVEVKARGPEGWGRPAEAVDGKKRRRIRLTAEAYLKELRVAPPPVRFDVVEVILEPGRVPEVTWVRGAFTVEGR
ncbi:MAG: YraN family protein [Verrucomicrobiia bacterium]